MTEEELTEFQTEMMGEGSVGQEDLWYLQFQVEKWADHNFPNAMPYQPLLGALEELGELAHAHLKHEQNIRGMTSELDVQGMKEDAVADVIIYLAHYCALNEIDMGKVVSETWRSVRLRDWQDDPVSAHETRSE